MTRLNRKSIGFRLTVWYAAVLTAGFALFGILIWFAMQHQMIAETDRELDGRASRFATFFEAESSEASSELRDELNEFCQALPPANSILVRGAYGFTFRCPASPIANAHVLHRQFTFQNQRFDVEVGATLQAVAHTLGLLRLLLLGLSPVVIVIACIGGAWLSRRALKPVQAIASAALTVSIDNLSERLPVPATGDELAALTEVLNSMLNKLESAVRTLSQFAADASHELRTPLAVIQTTADLALRRPRSPEELRQSLEQISSEAQRMTRLVEDLLFLARKDIVVAQMPQSPIDLRDLLRQVCTELSGLSAARSIRLNMRLGEAAAMVSGNAPALHRLFVALLDNALKYSQAGGEIVIALQLLDTSVVATIQDFGQGISAADLPHIFDRFFRADGSRTTGGYGLGLSLAKSIAQAHEAQIEVCSTPGTGSIFRVAFSIRLERTSGNLQLASV